MAPSPKPKSIIQTLGDLFRVSSPSIGAAAKYLVDQADSSNRDSSATRFRWEGLAWIHNQSLEHTLMFFVTDPPSGLPLPDNTVRAEFSKPILPNKDILLDCREFEKIESRVDVSVRLWVFPKIPGDDGARPESYFKQPTMAKGIRIDHQRLKEKKIIVLDVERDGKVKEIVDQGSLSALHKKLAAPVKEIVDQGSLSALHEKLAAPA